MRRVAVGGDIELAVEERGEGARPLVLVHGYTGTWRDFERELPSLAQAGRVLAPDLRGHGDSTKTGEADSYTLDALTDDLLGLLEALRIPRCDLLGHSMGGMLALRLALRAPERVASLLLMSTSAEPLRWVDPALLETACRVAREAGMAVLAAALEARAKDDPERGEPDRRVEREWGAEAFWAWRRARVAAMDPEAYAALGHAMVEQEPLDGKLAAIACPTLVLVGALDAEFRGPSRALAAAIPGAHLVELANAGHQPQHEAPAAWREAVLAHLAQVRGG